MDSRTWSTVLFRNALRTRRSPVDDGHSFNVFLSALRRELVRLSAPSRKSKSVSYRNPTPPSEDGKGCPASMSAG